MIDELMTDLDEIQVPDLWDEVTSRAALETESGDSVQVSLPTRRLPQLVAAALLLVSAGVLAAVLMRSEPAEPIPAAPAVTSAEADSDRFGRLPAELNLRSAAQGAEAARPTWLPGVGAVQAWEDPLAQMRQEGIAPAAAVWGRISGSDGGVTIHAALEIFGGPAEVDLFDDLCADAEERFETEAWRGCTALGGVLLASDQHLLALFQFADPLSAFERSSLVGVRDGEVEVDGEDLLAAGTTPRLVPLYVPPVASENDTEGQPSGDPSGEYSFAATSIVDPLLFLDPGAWLPLGAGLAGWRLGDVAVWFDGGTTFYAQTAAPEDLIRFASSVATTHPDEVIAVLLDDRLPLASRHGGAPNASRSLMLWYGGDDDYVLLTTSTGAAEAGRLAAPGPPASEPTVEWTAVPRVGDPGDAWVIDLEDGDTRIEWQIGPQTVVILHTNLPRAEALTLAESVELKSLEQVERLYGELPEHDATS